MTKEEFLQDIKRSRASITHVMGSPINEMYYLIIQFRFNSQENPYHVNIRHSDGGIQEFDLFYRLGELMVFVRNVKMFDDSFRIPENFDELANYLHLQERKIILTLEKYIINQKLKAHE